MSRAITATDFQRNVGEVLHEVQTHNTTYIVTQHGRDAIVLLHPDEYESLMEARRQLAWTRLARIGDTGSTEPQ